MGAFSVTLNQIIQECNLEIVYSDKDLNQVFITTTDVSRPGLQFVDFFDYFDNNRIQIFGKVERTFLEQKTPEQRLHCIREICRREIPAIIISRNQDTFPELLSAAEEFHIPILRTQQTTSKFMAKLIAFLNVELAERVTLHGVLCEVYGEGVLIMGESGVGKSETAIELVKRGHRLVADDAVEVKKVSDKSLVGTAPENIRHYIEIRGIGIIDVRRIFGMGSIKETEKIDLIIKLEAWDPKKQYDRLGLVTEYSELLGNRVPTLNIPVKPGRNLAVVVEVAAMNNRQKKLGYNAAEELNKRLMEQMSKDLQG
ncbi:MAG: HPr(Ser) kinase/phosphatase [Clostridia bacterium]|nr:HPr(Ser) kinase/phosphatase [Clostridia bacterium]